MTNSKPKPSGTAEILCGMKLSTSGYKEKSRYHKLSLSHLPVVASWSETFFVFAGIYFPPNRYLLFLYQYCQPDLFAKADGTNDRVTTQRNSDIKP